MQILVVNTNTTASMTAKLVRPPGPPLARHRSVRCQSGVRPRQHRGLLRRGLLDPRTACRNAQGAGGRRLCGRLFRRHRARCRPMYDERAGDRDRGSCVPSCEPARRPVQRCHDPVPFGPGDRAQSRPLWACESLRPGASVRCRGSRSRTPGVRCRARISAEIDHAIADDRAEAIVLGCAGMADLAAALAAEHGLPVVDGVGAAVKLAESSWALGSGHPNAAAMRCRIRSSTPVCSRRSRPATRLQSRSEQSPRQVRD